MIACFLSNISSKYYKNPSMLSRVIAKNVGDVFFETQCIYFSCIVMFTRRYTFLNINLTAWKTSILYFDNLTFDVTMSWSGRVTESETVKISDIKVFTKSILRTGCLPNKQITN